MPMSSTYSLTLITVSVYLARKPDWNMPEHASINQSVTVTHEDFSTLQPVGRGKRACQATDDCKH